MAMCTVCVHLFGDVPSNVVMGAVRKAVGGEDDPRAWRMMFFSGEVGLVPCVLLWMMSVCFGARAIALRGPDVARLRIFESLPSSPQESFIEEYHLDETDENHDKKLRYDEQ